MSLRYLYSHKKSPKFHISYTINLVLLEWKRYNTLGWNRIAMILMHLSWTSFCPLQNFNFLNLTCFCPNKRSQLICNIEFNNLQLPKPRNVHFECVTFSSSQNIIKMLYKIFCIEELKLLFQSLDNFPQTNKYTGCWKDIALLE